MTTVAAMVAARAEDDRPGVLSAAGTWTWRQAVAEGAARGALARSLCADRPPHIGVLLPNGPEYLFWLNGAALAGAAIVGVNPTRRGEALAADIRATDCAMIVTDAEGAALLSGLSLGLEPDHLLDIDTEGYRSLLAGFDATDPETSGPAAELIANAGDVDEDSLFQLIFTSGTTGTPKAVRCTQGRLAGIAEVAAPGYGYTSEDVCYCPMPLFHGNALMALWGPAVMVGAAIATRPRFSASAFIDDVHAFGATKFSYVGKAIAYILATPERPDDGENTLQSAFGTEASVRDRSRFRERFGCYLIEGYGQSEGGAAINPVLGMPKGALGKPVDGVDLAVISPTTGSECPRAVINDDGRLLNAGEAIGEIVNRSGRGKFEGYYRHESAEADRLRDGWYWTGDLGYVDADGFFYFAGRSGDWLRVDSENFAAGPVEAVLSRQDDFALTAVYPVPDTASGAGDQVMVAVEMVPDATFDPEAFAAWLKDQPDMGIKWIPRYVRISPSLPQTATGKVTKVGLREEGWMSGDDVWWWPLDASEVRYRLLTDADRRSLAEGLAAQGRAPVGAAVGAGDGQ
jgi:fatty-acyl-CoA synthase